jgi:tRNA A37 threonylcarbamoyladenosine synthetase subunit TsaC/SUA5/YrdC
MSRTRVLRPDEKSLALAAGILRGGGLVAFPTETVYGLGARAYDAAAARRVYRAKGRPSDNPLIVHVADEAARGRRQARHAAGFSSSSTPSGPDRSPSSSRSRPASPAR